MARRAYANSGLADILAVALLTVGGYILWRQYNGGDTIVPTLPGTSSGATPGGVPPANAPRGIRNNNPGNIEYNPANQWQGQTGTDGRFATFSSPVYGIRAAFKLLKTYRSAHGLQTIAQLGSRWAPTAEAGNSGWVNGVSRLSGFPATAVLNFGNAGTMIQLMRGIIGQENGAAYTRYYSDAVLMQAWSAS